MELISDFKQDVRHCPHQPGGYEWWYVDGISADLRYKFVVIFYEGNPFSTRYNSRLLKGQPAVPSEYPAISISIYQENDPIYYSFTEYKASDCNFSEEKPRAQIGEHSLLLEHQENLLAYKLDLNEELPNGDSLEANLVFKSRKSPKTLFENSFDSSNAGHLWNLVQPRAEVEGSIRLGMPGNTDKEIDFEGQGYHDHNNGTEPMRDEFTDWYWGRLHFESGSLIYYVMNRHGKQQHCAWLISSDNQKVLYTFDEVSLLDKGYTLFGLRPARKIMLWSGQNEVHIQHSMVVDNGPFYQRYSSDAFLRLADHDIVEKQQGISEYIYPDRIYSRAFWPFVNMRIRYRRENPHWVQKSKRLYRWTW